MDPLNHRQTHRLRALAHHLKYSPPSPPHARATGKLILTEYLMESIGAVIKPQKLDAVKPALTALGILGVTAMEVKGYGRQAGHTERYRGAKMDVGFVPKVVLQIVVKNSDREAAIKAIVEAARTGEVGDGKIFVFPVSKVIRIRTGEVDESAL